MTTERPKKETITEKSEFKGNAILSIYEVDEEGKKSQYSVIGFGKKKAQMILKHLDEIKNFAESN